MKITSIGMGQFNEVQGTYRAPISDFIPEPIKKTKSIMKMQQQILELENDTKFIKQTVETTALFKFNHVTRLNIV